MGGALLKDLVFFVVFWKSFIFLIFNFQHGVRSLIAHKEQTKKLIEVLFSSCFHTRS
jgi:hypothetical protein